MPQGDNETTERQRDPSTDDDHTEVAASTTPLDDFGDDGDKNDSDPLLSLSDRHEILQECEALVIYLARHGDALQETNELKESYKQLSCLVSQCKGRTLRSEEWPHLMQAYADVTRFTYGTRGVNGRSVLDTWGERDQPPRSWWDIRRWLPLVFASKRHQRPLRIAIRLSVSAILLQCLTGWAGRIDDPGTLSGGCFLLYNVVGDLAPLLIPAVWGGIGACVFLMKRITDRLATFAYEENRLKGYGTRIFLGAIFGVLVVQVFFPTHQENVALGDISLAPLTAAFIAGLGVKSIYAAFEALIEALAARMSGRRDPEV